MECHDCTVQANEMIFCVNKSNFDLEKKKKNMCSIGIALESCLLRIVSLSLRATM